MEPTKVNCIQCRQTTNHEVLLQHDTTWDQEEFSGADSWQIIRCLGCGDISFKHSNWFSEDYDEHGNVEEKSCIFPPRGEDVLKPKDFFSLDNTIRVIYRETINCFNSQCWMLCAT